VYYFSAKHEALRRKRKDWLAQNQNNVSEWNDMSIHTLLFQWASTSKIQLSVFVSSTKRTSSSSHWKLTCSHRNIAEKLLNWQLIRFRISAHNVEIEKGRHQNIPLNERICKLCKLEIEDEIHLLLQCPILNLFRTEAMQQISDICKMFASFIHWITNLNLFGYFQMKI
jgi:hypothetical protein